MLEHGGALNAAARRYGIPRADWLDLSTGINPRCYPLPALPTDCWRCLPQDDDGLLEAARLCYGAAHVLPVAGSQAAIQALPGLLPRGRLLLPLPTYAEHGAAWQRAGHQIKPLDCLLASPDLEAAAADCDSVLLCHPNNPTGARYQPLRLLALAQSLAARGGRLVVDEAFMDASPDASLAPHTGAPGLIVLRSLGKFYGLAGARVGFVLAWPELLERLQHSLGPWTLAGPARLVARAALADQAWQVANRLKLEQAGGRLARLLQAAGLGQPTGTALFQWLVHDQAEAIYEQLARQGVLVRLFRQPASLRFGLPAKEGDWLRLTAALKSATAALVPVPRRQQLELSLEMKA